MSSNRMEHNYLVNELFHYIAIHTIHHCFSIKLPLLNICKVFLNNVIISYTRAHCLQSENLAYNIKWQCTVNITCWDK